MPETILQVLQRTYAKVQPQPGHIGPFLATDIF